MKKYLLDLIEENFSAENSDCVITVQGNYIKITPVSNNVIVNYKKGSEELVAFLYENFIAPKSCFIKCSIPDGAVFVASDVSFEIRKVVRSEILALIESMYSSRSKSLFIPAGFSRNKRIYRLPLFRWINDYFVYSDIMTIKDSESILHLYMRFKQGAISKEALIACVQIMFDRLINDGKINSNGAEYASGNDSYWY